MRRAAPSLRQRAVDFNAPGYCSHSNDRPLAISSIDVAVATGGSGLNNCCCFKVCNNYIC
jgi:hypothetical protein